MNSTTRLTAYLVLGKKMRLAATSQGADTKGEVKRAFKSPALDLQMCSLPRHEIANHPSVKNPPAMKETRVQSPGWEDPLEKEMATHSSILAWRIPWTEDLAGYSPWSGKGVKHDWATNTSTFNLQAYAGRLTWYSLLDCPCVLEGMLVICKGYDLLSPFPYSVGTDCVLVSGSLDTQHTFSFLPTCAVSGCRRLFVASLSLRSKSLPANGRKSLRAKITGWSYKTNIGVSALRLYMHSRGTVSFAKSCTNINKAYGEK